VVWDWENNRLQSFPPIECPFIHLVFLRRDEVDALLTFSLSEVLVNMLGNKYPPLMPFSQVGWTSGYRSTLTVDELLEPISLHEVFSLIQYNQMFFG